MHIYSVPSSPGCGEVPKDMEASRYDTTSRCTTLSMIHSLHAFRTSVVRTVCDVKKYLYKYRLSSTPSFAPVKALHMLHLSSIVSLPVCQCVCAHPLISKQRHTLEEQLFAPPSQATAAGNCHRKTNERGLKTNVPVDVIVVACLS